MHRSDREFLQDILEACRRVQQYVEGLSYDAFMENKEKQDAVIRNIEIIGEAVKNISQNIKQKYTKINWKKIAGMRDKLIHFYFGINLEVVWVVATKEICKLETDIREIIEKQNY